MNKATVSQWERLYKITLDIKELQPWARLKSTDLIALENLMIDETYYFNFMGEDRSSYCIGCFIGQKGLEGFNQIRYSVNDMQKELIYEQYSMVAYFGAQADITHEDAALIRDLKLFFMENGDWLYFRSFEPGYVPWPLNCEEVLLLTDLFRELYSALKDLVKGDLTIDFTNQMLLRRFDSEKSERVSETVPVPEIRKEYESVQITDELMLARIMKRPLVDAKLEFDVFNIMIPIGDEKHKKPFYPIMALLADASTGLLVEFEVFTPEDSEIEHVIAILYGFIIKHGRPLIIYLQDARLKAILDSLCRRTAIPLEMVNFLPAINAFKLEKGISESVDAGEE